MRSNTQKLADDTQKKFMEENPMMDQADDYGEIVGREKGKKRKNRQDAIEDKQIAKARTNKKIAKRGNNGQKIDSEYEKMYKKSLGKTHKAFDGYKDKSEHNAKDDKYMTIVNANDEAKDQASSYIDSQAKKARNKEKARTKKGQIPGEDNLRRQAFTSATGIKDSPNLTITEGGNEDYGPPSEPVHMTFDEAALSSTEANKSVKRQKKINKKRKQMHPELRGNNGQKLNPEYEAMYKK